MYTHILIPTDGSELAGKAVQHGVALAKRIGAKVSMLTVLPPPMTRLTERWPRYAKRACRSMLRRFLALSQSKRQASYAR
jgi:nucleotide-binding universal stress UspA family protein